jgi:ABC-2 type transport system permease protein
MFLVELAKAFRRPRTYVLGALLAGVAVLPAVILATSQGSSGGPEFFDLIRRNGLFAALAAVVVIQPFILPLGAGLLSGESIAGEASGGTLRYLLVRPVSRVRLVLSKYGSVMALLAMAVAWVMLVGVVAGGAAFGYGPLPTLSGTTIGAAAAAARIALSAGYVVAGIAGLAAIGVFISTLTESAPGASIAAVAIAVISQILDGLSSLRVIHPYLLSHDWLAFADLFRSPVAWDAMRHGMLVFAAYTVLFLGAALAVMTRKDVTS